MNEDNVKGDFWQVFIDDVAAPFSSTLDVGEGLDVHRVTTQLYGTTPIGTILQGQKADLSFTFQELSVAESMRWNGITGVAAAENPLPPVGTKLPTHSVRLHNPADGADTTNDIYMPKVSFLGFSMSVSGTGNAEQKVPALAMMDLATGVLSQIGWVGP
jgi:hypothetical protein